MGTSDFYVDYETGVSNFTDDLKEEVEQRLLDLVGDHGDLTGAAVSVTAEAKNADAEPTFYRARVVVYTRPEYINATKEDDSIAGALKAALSAVERQVRDKRTKLGKPWERDDMKSQAMATDILSDPNIPDEVLDEILNDPVMTEDVLTDDADER